MCAARFGPEASLESLHRFRESETPPCSNEVPWVVVVVVEYSPTTSTFPPTLARSVVTRGVTVGGGRWVGGRNDRKAHNSNTIPPKTFSKRKDKIGETR